MPQACEAPSTGPSMKLGAYSLSERREGGAKPQKSAWGTALWVLVPATQGLLGQAGPVCCCPVSLYPRHKCWIESPCSRVSQCLTVKDMP